MKSFDTAALLEVAARLGAAALLGLGVLLAFSTDAFGAARGADAAAAAGTPAARNDSRHLAAQAGEEPEHAEFIEPAS